MASQRPTIAKNTQYSEYDNGRLLRLLLKLGTLNERPDQGGVGEWSETGERYILKLFRDYLFHQVRTFARSRLPVLAALFPVLSLPFLCVCVWLLFLRLLPCDDFVVVASGWCGKSCVGVLLPSPPSMSDQRV